MCSSKVFVLKGERRKKTDELIWEFSNWKMYHLIWLECYFFQVLKIQVHYTFSAKSAEIITKAYKYKFYLTYYVAKSFYFFPDQKKM